MVTKMYGSQLDLKDHFIYILLETSVKVTAKLTPEIVSIV